LAMTVAVDWVTVVVVGWQCPGGSGSVAVALWQCRPVAVARWQWHSVAVAVAQLPFSTAAIQ
jgi:hypothetical protein